MSTLKEELLKLLPPEIYEDATHLSYPKWNAIYDQCIWYVLTATEEDLTEVYDKSWSYDLPASIHANICQRLALITKDKDLQNKAISLVKIYCTPIEQERVDLGLE